ncbi:mnng and nitrosoguanidine resistance protein [Diplodia corticola]|uniref:Mnng and nitrosoguanidine resistance protein n=1 Tax=Diplodia corticola TaxID=236234 RepID=A0A1J9R2R0_9PEZI|nr:mnng and nitrosoguanidine resistance protein [Diplodia corticola]OJD34904.1 mnng and nitrosoguanidine resistance protein [Diplodia corticola]
MSAEGHQFSSRPEGSRFSNESKKEEPESPDSAEDGGDSGGPPSPVGFWDHRLRHVRLEAFRKWGYTTVVLMAFILAVLSIYWGAFFHLPANTRNLVVYVVDMDGAGQYSASVTGHAPIIGPAITELANQMLQQPPTLGYRIMSGAPFNNDPIQVRQAVYNQEAWASIVINPNATALLYNAIQTGNSSYDPLGACQLTYVEARDETTWADYIQPLLDQFTTQATATAGQRWASTALQLLTNASTNDPPAAPALLLTNLRAAPQALAPAVGFSRYNLRPFRPFAAEPAVSIGLIYLIILSFFSFSFYLPIHLKYLQPDQGHPPLRFWQLVVWRWCATLAAYLCLSLAYSLVSLAFQISFAGSATGDGFSEVLPTNAERGNAAAYGKGGAAFLVYWMLNFCGMAALGLACENVAMLIGQPWMGMWLIFWVITNVSTAFYDIDTEPAFYRWGYAWPLHHVVQGSRTILFDTHSNIGLNFGVLFAWAAVGTALFPFMCYWMRYKTKKGLQMYWA